MRAIVPEGQTSLQFTTNQEFHGTAIRQKPFLFKVFRHLSGNLPKGPSVRIKKAKSSYLMKSGSIYWATSLNCIWREHQASSINSLIPSLQSRTLKTLSLCCMASADLLSVSSVTGFSRMQTSPASLFFSIHHIHFNKIKLNELHKYNIIFSS